MGIERGTLKGIREGWSVPAKPCDSCKAAAAVVFCRSDSAFLCVSCDDKIHCNGNKLVTSRHGRVWVCEVCEQAPASVTCKADAAALCFTCDSDIHSANPLASRHERVPVEPFFDSAAKASAAASFNFAAPSTVEGVIGSNGFHDAEATASWLLSNPNPNVNFGSKITEAPNMKSGEMFFPEMDPFLDFEYSNSGNSFQNNNNNGVGNDGVVPVQTKPTPTPLMHQGSEPCFDIDFCRSKLASFNNYPAHSLNQSVSSSSLDIGVVPDTNTVSDISYPYMNMSNSSDSSGMVSAGNNTPNGLDREARVLRYREKRKSRKFEKTIRYASRKAYAETRPRIKGRFAKRTEIESEVDRLCGPAGTAAFMVDTQYGVVPSF